MLKEFRFDDSNVLTLEAPDLVVLRSAGLVDVAAVEHSFQKLIEISAEYGPPRVIAVMAEGTELTPAARRRISEATFPAKCWAGVAPSFALRAASNMIGRVRMLMGRKPDSKYFATEEEARRWAETYK